MYEKIVGEKLDLNIEPDEEDEYWASQPRHSARILLHEIADSTIKQILVSILLASSSHFFIKQINNSAIIF